MDPKILKVLAIGLVILGIFIYVNSQRYEGFADQNPQVDTIPAPQAPPQGTTPMPLSRGDVGAQIEGSRRPTDAVKTASQNNSLKYNTEVLPYPQISHSYEPQTGSSPALPNCSPRDTLKASELLPKDDPMNNWSKTNPVTVDGAGHLTDMNFLESGHHFGLNTQGSSLRNANKQLRSDPPIAQIQVGPWSQGTIDPDTNRRQFEIGGY